ncbi:MAG TPA: condensation domain-containing protein, partial [Micromonosporaceae bacterium]
MTELSPKERALWMFQQFATDAGVLNVPFAVRVPQRLRWWPLQEALLHLIRRHPNLRTLFPEVDGMPYRTVLPVDSPALGRAPLHTRASSDSRLERDLADFAATPFDLARDLPVRAAKFVLEDCDVLEVVVNHLVYDAVSASVLREELLTAYAGLAATNQVPAELAGQVEPPDQAVPAAASLAYWRERLAGAERRTASLDLGSAGQRKATFPGAR